MVDVPKGKEIGHPQNGIPKPGFVSSTRISEWKTRPSGCLPTVVIEKEKVAVQKFFSYEGEARIAISICRTPVWTPIG